MNKTSNEPPAVQPYPSGDDGPGGSGGPDDRGGRDRHEKRSHPITRLFDRFASFATRWAGTPYAFGAAVCAIVLWLLLGPVFRYSDAWQLIVNTGTTIVTFLMVFLLQQSQNKDSVAMHLKLDELLSSQRAASNALIGIEDASEEELRRLAAAYLKLASQQREPGDEREEERGDERGDRRGAPEPQRTSPADRPENERTSPAGRAPRNEDGAGA